MMILTRKRGIWILLVGAAAGAAIGLTAATATAQPKNGTLWTVKPGGIVTGAAVNPTLMDNATGTSVSCALSTAALTLKSGSRQTNPIGLITSVTFNSCAVPGGLSLTATASASPDDPWVLSGDSFSDGVATGTMSGVRASISGPGCSATLGGPTPTSAGSATGHYDNKNGVVTLLNGDLHIWNVSGCNGLINSGDSVSLDVAYEMSPHQVITSP